MCGPINYYVIKLIKFIFLILYLKIDMLLISYSYNEKFILFGPFRFRIWVIKEAATGSDGMTQWTITIFFENFLKCR